MALSRPLNAAMTPVALAADGTGQGYSRSYRRRFARESGPLLYADFTAGTLPAGWVFTRSSNATRVTPGGGVETVAANVPRFDHDPVTLAPLGLLIEQQSTNLLTWGSDLNNAAWQVVGAGRSTPGGRVSPDGSAAVQFSFPASTDRVLQLQSGITAGTYYTVSVWARKAASGAASNLRITTNNTAAWSTGFSQKFALTDQWQRFSVTGQMTSGTAMYAMFGRVDAASSDDVTCAGSVELWGAQLEQLAFPSSTIPTGASAATRAADACSVALGSGFNPAKGTLLVDASVLEPFAGGVLWPQLVNIDDGSPVNVIHAFTQVNAGNRDYGVFSRSGNVSQVNLSVGLGLATGTGHRLAIGWRYGSGTVRGAVDGAAVGSQAEGLAPVGLSMLRLGAFSQINTRRIRRVALYADLLTDANLRSVSA